MTQMVSKYLGHSLSPQKVISSGKRKSGDEQDHFFKEIKIGSFSSDESGSMSPCSSYDHNINEPVGSRPESSS